MHCALPRWRLSRAGKPVPHGDVREGFALAGPDVADSHPDAALYPLRQRYPGTRDSRAAVLCCAGAPYVTIPYGGYSTGSDSDFHPPSFASVETATDSGFGDSREARSSHCLLGHGPSVLNGVGSAHETSRDVQVTSFPLVSAPGEDEAWMREIMCSVKAVVDDAMS